MRHAPAGAHADWAGVGVGGAGVDVGEPVVGVVGEPVVGVVGEPVEGGLVGEPVVGVVGVPVEGGPVGALVVGGPGGGGKSSQASRPSGPKQASRAS